MIVNTVHDSIVFDVYPGELIPLSKICVDVMENIVRHTNELMPRIDMDWMISPLRADVDVGSHYGAMQALKDVDWYSIS
jgi:DNA polymerase I-like protein with 3'-5' exonuclease and polymerase domains